MNRNRDLVKLTNLYENVYMGDAQEAEDQNPLQNDEDNEDVGPNQQPKGWGDEAAEDEDEESTEDGDEEDEEDAEDEDEECAKDEDECACLARQKKKLIKKESYHGRANRDWAVLSESYSKIIKKLI